MSRVYIIRLFSVYGGITMKANKAKIIDLMCAKDLTQEQLAKGCGVRNCTITAILRGQREPTIKTINKIAVCLNCSPSEIVEV
jgi:transcriptional regulator with XRE-family HTH domain